MLRSSFPSDLDLYFDFKIVTLALIGIMWFFFTSNGATLLYIEKCNPDFSFTAQVPEYNFSGGLDSQIYLKNVSFDGNGTLGGLMKYKTDLVAQNFKIPYYVLFLYWVILPFIDLYYIIYCWITKSFLSPKDLYISLFLNNRVLIK